MGGGSPPVGATISLDETSRLNALNSQALQTQWFERSRAFGSTGVERKRILVRRKRIWIDSRRANAHLDRFENLKNVWHYTRNGFRARKLPNTTNLVVCEKKLVWIDRRRARAHPSGLAQTEMAQMYLLGIQPLAELAKRT